MNVTNVCFMWLCHCSFLWSPMPFPLESLIFPPSSVPTADISETLEICPRSLSRQVSSQLLSIGMHVLFYDGHCILLIWWEYDVPNSWHIECLLSFIMPNVPQLEGSGALGSNWLEWTLPGPLRVSTSGAVHVTLISFHGFWLYPCVHVFSFTTVLCHN